MARSRSSSVVADASVIIKWFINEDFSKQALRLKASHVALETKIIVPTLAKYEILNALKYSNKFGTNELLRIPQDLQGYQFLEILLDEKYGETAMKLASEHGITIYDASYIAIGQLRELDVFTADEKLLDKVRELEFVRHIRDYGG
jgi:predicted nucleic acid-binding protein